MRIIRRLSPGLVSLLLIACGGDGQEPETRNEYLNGNTPASLLEDFRRTWQYQDIDHYATLFSDDYAFYFDPETLAQNPTLPTFWGRDEDVESVGQLFASEEISDIRLMVLEYDPVPEPVEDVGREDWLLIRVTDEKLEIDIRPLPGENEGTTILIEGQLQHFYFRKGKTEADTLASSPTSGKYYIVRWEDFGRRGFHGFGGLTAIESVTWSRVKALYGD